MFELVLLIACCVAMYKIAEADDKSGIIWASATLALCIGCLFLIPLPFIRIFIAFILGFVLMTASNIWAK